MPSYVRFSASLSTLNFVLSITHRHQSHAEKEWEEKYAVPCFVISPPCILIYIIKLTLQRQIHWRTHHQIRHQNRKHLRYTLWDE